MHDRLFQQDGGQRGEQVRPRQRLRNRCSWPSARCSMSQNAMPKPRAPTPSGPPREARRRHHAGPTSGASARPPKRALARSVGHADGPESADPFASCSGDGSRRRERPRLRDERQGPMLKQTDETRPRPFRVFGSHGAPAETVGPLAYRFMADSGVLLVQPVGPLRATDFDVIALAVDRGAGLAARCTDSSSRRASFPAGRTSPGSSVTFRSLAGTATASAALPLRPTCTCPSSSRS